MRHLVRLTAAVWVLSLALAGPATAQKNLDPSQPSWVDLNAVLTEFRKTTAFARYQQRLRDQFRVMNEEMELLAQIRYCTEGERKEALAIHAKPRPTEKERSRLEELKKRADEVENELARLSQKAQPTPEELSRIQELSKLRTDSIQLLAREEADRRDQVRQLEANLMAEVEDELIKVVNRVAKDLKVGVVYNRQAILVGGNDLTTEVIKKLPK